MSRTVRVLQLSAALIAAVALLMLALVAFLDACRGASVLEARLKRLTSHFRQTEIVLLGDSILESLGEPADKVSNLSQSGATISWLRENRVDAVASTGASRVIVAAGINDLRSGASVDEVLESMEGLVAALQDRAQPPDIVVLSILPVDERSTYSALAANSEIDRVNAGLRAHAPSRYRFADIAELVRDQKGLDQRYSADGLHLNANGLSVLRRALFRGLAYH